MPMHVESDLHRIDLATERDLLDCSCRKESQTSVKRSDLMPQEQRRPNSKVWVR
jgi:hypothetical protein